MFVALENNAICDICGKPYRVCHTCQEIKSFKPWRTVTDTFPHYMIFLTLSDYTKNKNKEKAKKELSKCDLSELETFRPEIKSVIKEIMDDDKKVNVGLKKTVTKNEIKK